MCDPGTALLEWIGGAHAARRLSGGSHRDLREDRKTQ